eukprot:757143-Pleurochrysis_carterae.AAC.1
MDHSHARLRKRLNTSQRKGDRLIHSKTCMCKVPVDSQTQEYLSSNRFTSSVCLCASKRLKRMDARVRGQAVKVGERVRRRVHGACAYARALARIRRGLSGCVRLRPVAPDPVHVDVVDLSLLVLVVK